jgi:GTP-binding protein
VALVGFPNAGKSTFISRVSAAKPKIADYPFTTLQPNLGVVRFGEHEFVMADIPGLIEGASEGRGLGHQFLRHIERARVLVVLIDLGVSEGRSPAEQERILLEELGRYQPDLLHRPRVTVGSRADLAPADLSPAAVAAGPGGAELDGNGGAGHEDNGGAEGNGVAGEWAGSRFSAVNGDGLRPLIGQIATLVDEARAAQPRPVSFTVHRPEPAGIVVERDMSGDWVVLGRPAERAVALSNLTDVEALAYAQNRLKSLGVDKALAKAGAREGDRVHIGNFEFDYTQD